MKTAPEETLDAEVTRLRRRVASLERTLKVQDQKHGEVLRATIAMVVQNGGVVDIPKDLLTQAYAPGVRCERTYTDDGMRLSVSWPPSMRLPAPTEWPPQ